jgi:hypothetical protein
MQEKKGKCKLMHKIAFGGHVCLVCFPHTTKVEHLGQSNLYCCVDTCEPCKTFT